MVCPELLYCTIQRYKFESNSQHIRGEETSVPSCIARYKDTNLKAIHNQYIATMFFGVVVLHDTKIQI